MENLTSGAGASRWVPTVSGPKFIGRQVRNQKEGQLLQEAASLTPDSALLTKQLMDYKLPYADLAPAEAKLQGLMTQYVQEYSKSPFNAFSKEMKDKVREMQLTVTDPRLKQYEQEYDMFKKTIQKADDNGIANNINYKNGAIPVYRNGRRIWVDVDNVRPEDMPLNISQEHTFITDHSGFGGLEGEKYSIDMTSSKEVEDKILKYFTSIGSTTQDQYAEIGVSGEKSRDNRQQVQALYDALTSGAGLSNSDWNTLYSSYYTRSIADGKIPSKSEAKAEVLKYISDIADGKVVMSNTGSGKAPGAGGGAAGMEKNIQDLDPLTGAANGLSTPIALSMNINGENTGVFSQINGQVTPFAEFTVPNAVVVEEDNGNKRPSKALSNNEIMYYATRGFVPNGLTGGFDEIPQLGENKKAILLDDSKQVARVAVPTDANGIPASAEMQAKLVAFAKQLQTDPKSVLKNGVPPEIRPFLKPTVNDQGQQGFDINYVSYFAVPTISPKGGNAAVDALSQVFQGGGYQEEDMTSDQAQEYTLHNTAGIDNNNVFQFPGSDNQYKSTMLFPAPPDEALRMIAQANVKIPLPAATAGQMSQKSNTIFLPLGFTNPDPKARGAMVDSGFLTQNSFASSKK